MAEPRTRTASPAGRGAPRRKRKLTWKRVVGRIAVVTTVGALVLALVAAIAGLMFYQRTTLPDPNKDFNTNTTFVNYRDGKTRIGSFAVQNRTSIPYAQMSDNIKDAVVAAENRTFWTDRGISPSGIARSIVQIVRGGEIQGGGSTITQQYIKIYYLTSDRTMSRKFRELALAVKLGKERSKQEILRDYLNTIYFGRGAYGIQAASRAYFNIDAKDLSLDQAAVLASVLNNPSLFDPSEGPNNSKRLLDRYRYVLDGMLEMGKITKAEHDKAYQQLPSFPEVPLNTRYGGTKGYLLTAVRKELLNNGFTDAQISGGGLNVTTTFDATMQAQAVKVGQAYRTSVAKAASPKQDPDKLHIAIASVQVGTGEVLAMYGGDDYVKNSRNWATTDRAAASTFKPYATVAGLRNGFSLRSRLNGDTFTPTGDSSPIRNEFNHQYGQVSLLKATEESINTAFVDLTEQIPNGPTAVIKAATDAGVPKGPGWDNNNRIALGTAEVSPLEQAGGYATFANDGKQVGNHVVAKVTDIDGKTLYENKPKAQQKIEADISKDVTYSLQSVVKQGTGGRVADLGYDVAGKTGTSGVGTAITSAWFVAYTKQISTSVMFVAGDGGNGDLDPYKRPGDGTFFGGTYPAMVWADYMKVAMKGQKNIPFAPPVWVNSGSKKDSTVNPSSPSPTPSSATPSVSTPPPSSATPSVAPSTQAPSSQVPSQPVPSAPAPSQLPTSVAPSVQPSVSVAPTAGASSASATP
ncbi:transglycosylase domain-containing protein [Aestuariimicrobium sp. T2.26MG-19.2B]|uniref:transglycosylase domain-containing protein n=1 Tax=Aestuariimicrobium sp. T2.26MG-19.2B TaxID=3040679 RepID=UPI002477C951|nr:transglycosylase domain-containing protein [Aestuariimicrobium sp. T2.26MG-19.2B]CAI9403079.1 Penicillin-binding protein 1A [Aestuariimicrobium sp. T2.26MG-19.2B]